MSEPAKKRRSRTAAEVKADPELSQKIADTIQSLRDFPNPTVVVGDGWAAMAAVGFSATAAGDGNPRNVLWILNSGTHAMAPLPFVESGIAIEAWKALAERVGVFSEKAGEPSEDEPSTGHFLREFKNRSFARAPWHKSPTRELREETRAEWLWGPETRIAPLFEARFELPLGELEERIRARLASLPHVRILSGVPVVGFEAGPRVTLATGESIPFAEAIWADRWVGLGSVEGLPKNLGLARNREPVGILQAVFTHRSSMVQQSMREGFFATTHKDAGEAFSRAVWGYFFEGGRKSVWSLFLTEDEGLDNHVIGKKYRRMKQAIEKMFTGPEWLPEGAQGFFDTVETEQLIFQEDFIFANGEAVTEPQTLDSAVSGKTSKKKARTAKDAAATDLTLPIVFVTDAFGPSAALEQVARLYAEELGLNAEGGVLPSSGLSDGSSSELALEPLVESAAEDAVSPEEGGAKA
jgi:hypothetical protein